MDKLMWVKKLRQILSPGYVVNLCFFIVFCFSTLLIWGEIKVLEEAYVANQRNNLENVSHEFDSLLQFNIDRMIFFRNGMQSALGTPLDFVVLRKAEEDYLKKRHDPLWSVEIHNRRTLPVYGVADAFVDGDALLSRDNSFSGNELMATLELGYMLRLANNNRGFAKRMLYVSRNGFFTTTEPLKNATQALALYSRATSAPWFTRQTQRNNPARGIVWQTFPDEASQHEMQVVTASIPLDFQRYWLGVLAMDFSVQEMKTFLVNAIKTGEEGEYQLYDNQLNLIASSAPGNVLTLLSPREQEMLSRASSHENQGGFAWSRVISAGKTYAILMGY